MRHFFVRPTPNGCHFLTPYVTNDLLRLLLHQWQVEVTTKISSQRSLLNYEFIPRGQIIFVCYAWDSFHCTEVVACEQYVYSLNRSAGLVILIRLPIVALDLHKL